MRTRKFIQVPLFLSLLTVSSIDIRSVGPSYNQQSMVKWLRGHMNVVSVVANVLRILTEDEREAFAVFIAQNPRAGSVVRGSGGVRKVRWAREGSGKSGGARVIYYNRLDNGEIWLLTLYAKSDHSTIPAHELKMIKEVIDRD